MVGFAAKGAVSAPRRALCGIPAARPTTWARVRRLTRGNIEMHSSPGRGTTRQAADKPSAALVSATRAGKGTGSEGSAGRDVRLETFGRTSGLRKATLACQPNADGGRNLTIGVAVFLIALGAILRYAITFSIAGVSLATVGLILMIAGAVGLIAAIITARRGSESTTDRRVVDRY